MPCMGKGPTQSPTHQEPHWGPVLAHLWQAGLQWWPWSALLVPGIASVPASVATLCVLREDRSGWPRGEARASQDVSSCPDSLLLGDAPWWVFTRLSTRVLPGLLVPIVQPVLSMLLTSHPGIYLLSPDRVTLPMAKLSLCTVSQGLS